MLYNCQFVKVAQQSEQSIVVYTFAHLQFYQTLKMVFIQHSDLLPDLLSTSWLIFMHS